MSEQTKAFEKQYTVHELAELWNLDRKTVTRMFQHEVGVLKICDPGARGTAKKKTTLRIPTSMVERVHAEWSK